MGKRKGKSKKTWEKLESNKVISKEDNSIDVDSRNFVYDEVDEFENRNDQDIMDAVETQMAGKEAQLEQVMGIGGDSDSELDDSDFENDLEEDLVEDDILEETTEEPLHDRAWGSNKSTFYGSDLKDERFNKVTASYGTKQAERLQVELEGVKRLQDTMREQFAGNVFDTFNVPVESEKQDEIEKDIEMETEGSVVIDSPHIKEYIKEIKDINEYLKSTIVPLYEAMKKNHKFSDAVAEYLKLRYYSSLNYIAAISSYLLLYKEGPRPVSKKHSIFILLGHYKQIMKQLYSYDHRLESCLKDLLDQLKKGSLPKIKKQRVTRTAPADTLTAKVATKKASSSKKKQQTPVSYSLLDGYVETDSEAEDEPSSKKKVRFAEDTVVNEEEREPASEGDEEEGPDSEKRLITEEIKKNRGLTPLRNKDEKNPRVRYRRKYQSKLKKRKGQVQPMRSENKKYDGERTGISTHTVRSIKLK